MYEASLNSILLYLLSDFNTQCYVSFNGYMWCFASVLFCLYFNVIWHLFKLLII